MKFLARLNEIEERYSELEQKLNSPEVFSSPEQYQKLFQRFNSLKPIVDTFREWKKVSEEIEENQEILNGEDKELAEWSSKINKVKSRFDFLENTLKKA